MAALLPIHCVDATMAEERTATQRPEWGTRWALAGATPYAPFEIFYLAAAFGDGILLCSIGKQPIMEKNRNKRNFVQTEQDASCRSCPVFQALGQETAA